MATEAEPLDPPSSASTTTTTAKQQQPQEHHVVVIVGAGMAGLACAHHLLKASAPSSHLQITLVEAASQAGGRVWGSSLLLSDDENTTIDDDGSMMLGMGVDLGAELIHGRGTVLTELIETELGMQDANGTWNEFWIAAHADGGPTESATTVAGKYGRYYIDGAFCAADDPRVQQLTRALEQMYTDDNDNNDDDDESNSATKQCSILSVGEALLAQQQTTQQQPSTTFQKLAKASFGNTAGCTDLHQLSLPVLRHFEAHWEHHEEAGDYQLNGGMHHVVERWVELLLAFNNKNNNKPDGDNCAMEDTTPRPIQFEYNWRVQTIEQQPTTTRSSSSPAKLTIRSHDGATLHADWVVVTVPPPVLLEILDEPLLSPAKRTALEYVGFARAIKVVCWFRERLWPRDLQSLIVASAAAAASDDDNRTEPLPIPEMWFRDVTGDDDDQNRCYIMVGYLTSQFADDFVQQIQHRKRFHNQTRDEAAASLAVQQLAHMFQHDPSDCHAALLRTIVCDWRDDHPHIRGGYMYPATGMTVSHLHDLAAREGNVLFAGEATNTNACCTLQAAMETGIRAAKEILEDLQQLPTRL